VTTASRVLDGDPLFYCGDELQQAKVARMRAAMAQSEFDAVLFVKHDAVRWVTGFYAKGYRPFIELEYIALVVADGPIILGTSLPGEEQLIGTRSRADEVVQLGKRPVWPGVIGSLLKRHRLEGKRIGFDFLTHDLHAALSAQFPDATLVDAAGLWTAITQTKFDAEVDLIRSALELTQRGMAVAAEMIASGKPVREIDIAAAAEYEMRSGGSEMTPFISIVASGPNSSVFQRVAGERLLGEGELVIVDLGCVYRGYTGDFARTLVRGAPSDEQKRMYRAAHTAQLEALAAIRPGVRCEEIDYLVRSVLAREGYADGTMRWAVGHQLGYGLHGAPLIAPGVTDTFCAGMVVNIEPAVCLPGRPDVGGVEIEDTVLVTEGGCKRLTDFPYEQRLLA
jgi:Xaa-Pro aminopeptidase